MRRVRPSSRISTRTLSATRRSTRTRPSCAGTPTGWSRCSPAPETFWRGPASEGYHQLRRGAADVRLVPMLVRTTCAAPSDAMRVSPSILLIVGGLAVLVALGVTDRLLPASDPGVAQVRPWIAARALGVTAYLLLALETALGLVLSHPRNTASWRLTKPVFPWHELLTVFTGAFLALHGALLAIDPYAGVGIAGALIPGLSGYRPPAVALGTVAAYALIITAVTAKWTRLLPSGWWLRIHRLAALTFLLTWLHAVLAGTDGGALLPLYLVTGVPVVAGVAHRWWTAKARPVRRVATPASSPTAGSRPAASPAEVSR